MFFSQDSGCTAQLLLELKVNHISFSAYMFIEYNLIKTLFYLDVLMNLLREFEILNIVLIFLRLIPKNCKCSAPLLPVVKSLPQLMPIRLKR